MKKGKKNRSAKRYLQRKERKKQNSRCLKSQSRIMKVRWMTSLRNSLKNRGKIEPAMIMSI